MCFVDVAAFLLLMSCVLVADVDVFLTDVDVSLFMLRVLG